MGVFFPFFGFHETVFQPVHLVSRVTQGNCVSSRSYLTRTMIQVVNERERTIEVVQKHFVVKD